MKKRGSKCSRTGLPASANTRPNARPNVGTVGPQGTVPCSWRHLGGNLHAGDTRDGLCAIDTAVLALCGRCTATTRIRRAIRVREGLAEPVQLAVELCAVGHIAEVELAHFEERGRGEERVRASLVRWPDAHHLERHYVLAEQSTAERDTHLPPGRRRRLGVRL